MSAVGIVSIALGVVGVCTQGSLLVAPAATLRWFNGTIRTNGRMRVLGTFYLTLGATMVWVGVSEGSTLLAFILFLFGLGIVGIIAPLTVLFPGFFRAFINAMTMKVPGKGVPMIFSADSRDVSDGADRRV